MWTKDQMPDLTGKTIIVTGANTGIGYETAKALYEKGATVMHCPQKVRHFLGAFLWEKGQNTIMIFGIYVLKLY